MEHYVPPKLTELGSIRELTHQTVNKVGATPDSFTAITNGIVVGSIINSP